MTAAMTSTSPSTPTTSRVRRLRGGVSSEPGRHERRLIRRPVGAGGHQPDQRHARVVAQQPARAAEQHAAVVQLLVGAEPAGAQVGADLVAGQVPGGDGHDDLDLARRTRPRGERPSAPGGRACPPDPHGVAGAGAAHGQLPAREREDAADAGPGEEPRVQNEETPQPGGRGVVRVRFLLSWQAIPATARCPPRR